MTNEEAKEILEKMGATKQEHWEAVKVAIRVLDEAGKTEPKQPTYGIKGSGADVEFELVQGESEVTLKQVELPKDSILTILPDGSLYRYSHTLHVPGLQLDDTGRIKVTE